MPPLPRTLSAAAGLAAAFASALPGGAAAQPAPRVAEAAGGLFAAPGHAQAPFTPSTRLPLRDGQAFGWRLRLDPAPAASAGVRVRETLTLPAEPRTWGDPDPEAALSRRNTPDGLSLVSEYRLTPRDGWIANAWTVTQGDPPGRWTITVEVQGQPARVFHFDAR